MAALTVPATFTSILPPDVIFEIIEMLPPAERVKILSLNRWFFYTFGDPLLGRYMREGAVFYLDVDPWTPPSLDSKGRADAPFVVERKEQCADYRSILHVRYPVYDQWGYKANQIHVEGDVVAADPTYLKAGMANGSPTGTVDWYSECSQGRLRVVDGETFRCRFMQDCRVCNGKREKCAGCGVAGCWPRAWGSCGWVIPCPLCVGEEAAVKGKETCAEQKERKLRELRALGNGARLESNPQPAQNLSNAIALGQNWLNGPPAVMA